MKRSRMIMGMPVSVEIVDANADEAAFEKVFAYLAHIDDTFSTYKPSSEISALNAGAVKAEQCSPEVQLVLAMCEETKKATNGYFDIRTPDGRMDPSGLVKGWAVWNAAQILLNDGHKDLYVDAGGDIQPHGRNAHGDKWQVGIRDPFHPDSEKMVKVLAVQDEGVATSGTYLRGQHIYDPHGGQKEIRDVVSLTVVGPTVYEADRFATAAFAMGKDGIAFIEQLPGFEGYQIDATGVATLTSGFERYISTP